MLQELDLIVKRFLLKKYKINVYYSRRISLKNNLGYKNFRLKILAFIRDIIFDLRPRSLQNFTKNKVYGKSNYKKNVLILAHSLSNSFEAYKNLPTKLSLFLKQKKHSLEVILPSEIGINVFEKLKYSIVILKKLLQCYFVSFLKLSDYHFIILEIYNEIYKDKLRKYFSSNRIIFVICSYIDSRYEPLYYEVAKELKNKIL